VGESRGGCVVVGQWAMAWLVSLLVLVLVLVSVERRAGAAAAVGDGGASLRCCGCKE
jgi:preprotein translocase subunit SecG